MPHGIPNMVKMFVSPMVAGNPVPDRVCNMDVALPITLQWTCARHRIPIVIPVIPLYVRARQCFYPIYLLASR